MERPDDKNPRCCCAAVPVQNKSVPKMAQVQATFMDHLEATHSHIYIYPKCSMYGIFTYIYPKNGTHVGKYSIQGASGSDFPWLC